MNDRESNIEVFMNKVIDENKSTKLTDEDMEFEKYCKLYKKEFGKEAYISEPNGTKEQTINAIKTSLEKKEDLLDKLLYINEKNDIEDDILY